MRVLAATRRLAPRRGLAAAAAVACALVWTASGSAVPAAATGRLMVSGPPELVYDHAQQACEQRDYPDQSARALRTSDGQVMLYFGSGAGAYASVGPDLNHLEHRCVKIFASQLDTDPSHFAMREWLGGGYTEDGSTIYAFVGADYHGEGSGVCNATSRIDRADWVDCWMPSVTQAVSTDGGQSFETLVARPVATMPYTFTQFRHSRLF